MMRRFTIKDLRRALMGMRTFVQQDLQGQLCFIELKNQQERVVFDCPTTVKSRIKELPAVTQWALKGFFPSAIIPKGGSISIGAFFVNIEEIMSELTGQIRLVFSYGPSRAYK